MHSFTNDLRKTCRKLAIFGNPDFSPVRIERSFPGVQAEVLPDRSAIVASRGDRGLLLPELMRWGFPPQGGRLVTTVRHPERPIWKLWFKPDHRALVPATKFVLKATRASSGMTLERPGGLPMFFAALWRPERVITGAKYHRVEKVVNRFAIVLAEPDHDFALPGTRRIPLILERPQWSDWLSGSAADALNLCRQRVSMRLQVCAEPRI